MRKRAGAAAIRLMAEVSRPAKDEELVLLLAA
jgi:hypothetical protein